MRIILFTGKGGVGKTTIAAATALRAAQRGHRTIVLSTDAAHSLADSFDLPLAAEPTQIAPNLWGQETDVYYNLAKYWGTVQEWLRDLLAWRGIEDIVADDIAVLPGMEELSNLLWINQHYDSGLFDLIIVDCAPTGETLKLLSFPEAARWWVEKILPIQRRVMGVVRPVVRPFTRIPLPTEDVYSAGQELFQRLEHLHHLLSDPDIASIRLVLNAEKMVIKEAQRTFTYLNLYGYLTDAVICNRLLPAQVLDRYFDTWKQTQEEYFRYIETCFSPLPILKAPLLDQEVVGLPLLDEMAQALYADADPAAILHRGQAQQVCHEDGRYVLTISLPFVGREDLSLVRSGDELVVHAGAHKRNIILPRLLRDMETHSAKFEGNNLRITFLPPGHRQDKQAPSDKKNRRKKQP